MCSAPPRTQTIAIRPRRHSSGATLCRASSAPQPTPTVSGVRSRPGDRRPARLTVRSPSACRRPRVRRRETPPGGSQSPSASNMDDCFCYRCDRGPFLPWAFSSMLILRIHTETTLFPRSGCLGDQTTAFVEARLIQHSAVECIGDRFQTFIAGWFRNDLGGRVSVRVSGSAAEHVAEKLAQVPRRTFHLKMFCDGKFFSRPYGTLASGPQAQTQGLHKSSVLEAELSTRRLSTAGPVTASCAF